MQPMPAFNLAASSRISKVLFPELCGLFNSKHRTDKAD